MKPLSRRFAWACLLLLAASSALAAPVPADPAQARQALSADLIVIPDRDDRLDPDAVRAGTHDALALAPIRGIRNLGFVNHPYWVRISLQAAGGVPLDRLLVLRRGAKYAQQIWIDRGDGSPPRTLRIGPGGTASGDASSRHAVIRLALSPDRPTTVTVRLDSRLGTTLDYELRDEASFARSEITASWLFGSLFGLLMAIAVYVFALYLATRDLLYAWFTGFAIGMCSFIMHYEGYALLGFWGNAQTAAAIAAVWSVVTQNCFTLLFARRFIDTPRHFPTLDRRVLQPVLAIWALSALLYVVRPSMALGIIAGLSLLAILLVGALTALSRWRGQIAGWLFPAAVLTFWISSFGFIAKQAGLIADHQLIGTLQPILSGMVMLLFAFAVARRFREATEALTAALRRNEERLETTVAERTAELRDAKSRAEAALAQLRDTQHLLVATEKMASLGQLVAGVAHEVNTPLGVAYTASTHLQARLGWLQDQLKGTQLRRSELMEFGVDAQEGLRLVRGNLERAAALVRSFKQISVDRSSEGRRSFLLGDYLRVLADTLAPSWRRAGVETGIDCPDGLLLDSYPGALGQVITQLVQNALLHAFADTPAPRLWISVRTDGGAQCVIEVADNGCGADAEILPRLFDPFFTTRRGQGNTGLGLSVAYNLAQARLGGSLQAEARPGGGLCMVLRIPVSAPH